MSTVFDRPHQVVQRTVHPLGRAETQIISLGDELLAERRDLVEVVASLPVEAWHGKGPNQDRSIIDHVTHLAYLDDAARGAIEGQVPGLYRLDASRSGEYAVPDVVAALHGSLRPRSALLWLDEAGRALVRSAALADPCRRIPWYGTDASVESLLLARIVDTWARCEDAHAAIGVPRQWSPRLHFVATEGVRSLVPSFRAHGLPTPTADVRVELDGWVHGHPGAANRVSGSLVDFCLLVTNRRQLADTELVAQGPVAEQWVKIARTFVGVPREVSHCRRST